MEKKIEVKHETLFKNKIQMVIYFIIFCLLIWAFIYIGMQDYNPKLPDNERFASEFNLVSENNVYEYINASKALLIASGTKGIILFGTKNNEWVNYYANIVNDIAKEVGIDKIYYYDFFKNREDNNGTYQAIVEKLSEYVTYNDYGIADIYAPSLLVVSNDKVLLFDTETTFREGDIEPSKYWNTFNINSKKSELQIIFKEYKES